MAKTEKTKTTKTQKAEQALVQVPEFNFIKKELENVGAIKKSFNEAQLKFIRNTVNKDLTDTELLVFLSFCSKLQLNPILGEVVAIVYHKHDPSRRTVNYIIPRDGKRIVATRTGGLESIKKDAIYVREVTEKDEAGNEIGKSSHRVEPWESGKLWGATATVKRDGVDHTVTVPLSEYNTGQNVWKDKPETMIKKVAESQALSSAYPELLGGVYDDAEFSSMPKNGQKEVVVVDGDEPATEAQIDQLKLQGKEIPEDLTREQAVKLLTSKKKGNGNDSTN